MSLPSAGDVIAGKYRVGSTIAEGGMGVVVEGVHVQLEDAVAIKFLKPDVVSGADGEVVKRFMREARTCIKIRSEHVVRVLDVDTLPSGVPYIVMERLSGRDLDAIVEMSGPLGVTSAIDYVLQALEALAEAHVLGIVHRDLKPANLFLTERADGSPCIKVLDFGISKIETGHDGGMTQTQAVMGSPRYMSPEQLRASRDVDARTDIWAMGVVLYELFTGRAPFDGVSMTQIAAAILENTPAPLSLRTEHAAAIETIVMRCLSKRHVDRYVDVAELAAALAPFGSPSAAVSAGRIHGVIHRGASATATPPSRPSLPSMPRVSHQASGTDVTWADAKGVSTQNRRLGVYAAVAALFAVVGVALVALAVTRKHDVPSNESAAAAPPPAVMSAPIARAASVNPEPAPAPVVLASAMPKEAAPIIALEPSVRPAPRPLAAPSTARVAAPKARPTASPATTGTAAPLSTTWSDRK